VGAYYWIWDALAVVRPRVVVVETQELWGTSESRTRPYDPRHVSPEIPAMGASLAAFVHLATRRGYRLVGCMQLGFNAFFVREGAVSGGLDALFGAHAYDPQGCFGHVDAAWAGVLRERRRAAAKYSWVDPANASWAASAFVLAANAPAPRKLVLCFPISHGQEAASAESRGADGGERVRVRAQRPA